MLKMKEIKQPKHYHLEALHQVTAVPFQEKLGTRANKEQILSESGFSQGTNIAIRRKFFLSGDNNDDLGIKQYLTEQLEGGRFISMLFKDNKWDAVGGSQVVYIMDCDDLETKLTFGKNSLREARAHSGDSIVVDHSIELQTYSRRKSIVSELSGFANYDGTLPVGLGGGFRLQVDNLTFVNGEPYLSISGYFSFNDMGSRVLALSCDGDRRVPRYETSFLLQIDRGLLLFSGSKKGRLCMTDVKKVGVLVNEVLHSLFERDGEAISHLVRGLLSVRPVMQVHQLEGIFSIPNGTEISAEVIDFDGIDSFDLLSYKNQTIALPEKLAHAQLRSVGYLLSGSEELLSYITFRRKIREAVEEINNLPIVPEEVRVELSRYTSDPIETFIREQPGSVKLGRLLDILDVDWNKIDNSNIKIAQYNENTLIMISVEGFNLGFWSNDSKLVDCSEIRPVSMRLSKIIGKEVLPVHLSSLREGD